MRWHKRPVGPARDRRASGERGFTLLELLVTLAITTIGMAGLVSLNRVTSTGTALSGRSAEATAAAQQVMESLRAQPINTMLTAMGCANPSTCSSATQISTVPGRSGMTYTATATATELTTSSAGGMIRLRVEVTWTDDGATANADSNHAVAIELLRTRLEPL